MLTAGFSLSAQIVEEEQVDNWSDGPARVKLEQIEKYKPQVRRSRLIAINELEEDVKKAKQSISQAQRLMRYKLSRDGRNSEDAWDSLQVQQAQTELDNLKGFVKEAEEYLVYAKAENEKVMKYLVRERTLADAEEDGEEGDDEEDEDDDEVDPDEGVDTDPQLRIKTRLSPEVDEEEDIDED